MLTKNEISNSDDVIDSRDVIARIEELHAIATDDGVDQNERTHANNELGVLQALQDEAEGYAPDWKHGATLVRYSYWVEYVTAENIRMDYTTVDFDGVEYYVR